MAQQVDELYNDKEAEKIQKYIETYYAAKVPPPTPPTKEDLSFLKLAGFEAVSFSIPAMAMVVFSAIRTGGFFFILEQKLLNSFGLPSTMVWILSITIMIAALFGFEGYALARGMKQGRESMTIEENRAGTVFTFIIIVAVGIFSGLEIVDISPSLQQFIDVLMAVVTGLGSGIITFFGGKDIGIAIKKFNVEVDVIKQKYKDDFKAWREDGIASYLSVKSRLSKANQNIRDETKTNPPEENNVNEQSGTKEKDWRKASLAFDKKDYLFLGNMSRADMETLAKEREFDVKTSENWKKNAQKWLMADFIDANKQFPSVEVIESFGMNSKDASRFVIQNKQKLLEMGLITLEFVDLAEQTLNQ